MDFDMTLDLATSILSGMAAQTTAMITSCSRGGDKRTTRGKGSTTPLVMLPLFHWFNIYLITYHRWYSVW